jgi:multiple sugar transport system permease protein
VTARSREEKVWGTLKWVSIALFFIVTVFPLIYMVGLSFKDVSELFRNPANFFPSWDQIFSFDTYRQVLRSRDAGGQGFWVFIRNSALVSFVTVVVTTTLGVLAAYAVARLNFFGKRAISLGIILVYLFPAVVIAIPLFVMFSRTGTVDVEIFGLTLGLPGLDLFGLMIVYVAQTIPVALYMLRSYFTSIPKELEEAGLIDGLSHWGVMRRITLPLSAPAVAAVALFVFMIAWNEFLFALLFILQDQSAWTLALGVQQLDTTEVPRTLLMAGSVLITLPVIVLFFATERFLTEGLTAGSVKG